MLCIHIFFLLLFHTFSFAAAKASFLPSDQALAISWLAGKAVKEEPSYSSQSIIRSFQKNGLISLLAIFHERILLRRSFHSSIGLGSLDTASKSVASLSKSKRLSCMGAGVS